MMSEARQEQIKIKDPHRDKKKTEYQCEECECPMSRHQFEKGFGLCPYCQENC